MAAVAMFDRPTKKKMGWALFNYFVLTWAPIAISGLLFVLWNLATGDDLPVLTLVVFLLVMRQFMMVQFLIRASMVPQFLMMLFVLLHVV